MTILLLTESIFLYDKKSTFEYEFLDIKIVDIFSYGRHMKMSNEILNYSELINSILEMKFDRK